MLKNLINRTVTGAIFAGLTIGSILWDPFFFAGIFLVFCVIGFFEFYRLFKQNGVQPQKVAGIIAGIITYSLMAFVARDAMDPAWLLLIIPAVFLPFVTEIYRNKPQPFYNIAITLLPVIYIAFPLAALNFLFSPWHFTGEYYPNILLGFFIIFWTGDTMAYLGGSKFGKHRLFERISPKKSWEGSIIGALFSLGMAWFLSIFFKELNTWQWLGMSAVIVVAGTYGDLVESVLKRSACVKDSGTIFPGHGGILDRFDGVLIGAPLVFVYLYLVNHVL
jgi:phosphatidate cytidylyltransferase